MVYLRFATTMLVVAIYGCANTNNKTTTANINDNNQSPAINSQAYVEKTAKALYLRGSFNLWDYQEQYRLFQVAPRTFAAAAQLTEGQRYEFLFSAKDASKPNSNCGHSKQAQIQLNVKTKANCNNIVLESFVFIAPKSATYEFFIELESINNPLVYIKKAF